MIISFWMNRALIKTLAKREVIGRYKGSLFGILWSFFNPIFMLIVYTFVFSIIFKSKWNGGNGSKAEFAIVLFAGLIVFNLFSECVSRSPTLILSNSNYVKKVIFPLEILPFVSLASSMFHAGVSLLVWIFAYLIFFGAPPLTILLAPLVFLPVVMLIIGLSWFLASLGVYIRDIPQIVSIFISVLMFLSPIFYPISALPQTFQFVVGLNPIAQSIEQLREVLFWGVLPDMHIWLISMAASTLCAVLGFAWFQKTRKGFADVI